MSLELKKEIVIGFIIEILFFLLILFSPAIYGGITNLPLSLIEAACFLILFLLFLKSILKSEISVIKIPFLPLILFILLIFLQIIPLKEWFLEIISPSTALIYKNFRADNLSHLTLSVNIDSTVYLLLQLLAFAAIFFVAINYFNTEEKISRLIYCIVLAGVIYSLYGIVSKLNSPEEVFSTFTNRNHFSAYIQMIIPLAISISLVEASRVKKAVFIFASVVMILALFFSSSRAGRVCFIFSLIIFLSFLRFRGYLGKIILPMAIISLFLVFFINIIGLAPFINGLDTLTAPFKEYSPRLQIAKDAIGIVKHFPIFGTGFGTYADIAQKYKTSDWQVLYAFCHNEPLQVLVETGALGALLVILFFILYFRDVIRLWAQRHNQFSVYITLGCLVGIFSIGMHSLFDFVFHIPANSLLFFIILALVYKTASIRNNQETGPSLEHKFVFNNYYKTVILLILCPVLFFTLTIVFRRFKSEAIFEHVNKASFEDAQGEDAMLLYRKSIISLKEAASLNPGNSFLADKEATLLVEVGMRKDTQDYVSLMGNFKDKDESLREAKGLYKIAINLNPAKADFHLRLGWLYDVLGESKSAKAEFAKAIILDPKNTTIQSQVEQYLKAT